MKSEKPVFLYQGLLLCGCIVFLIAVCSCSSPYGDRTSQFPWPPPLPSAALTFPIPPWWSQPGETYGDVDDAVSCLLEMGGYGDHKRYFAVPGGFAIATQMEHIEADGSPTADRRRWDLQPETIAEFSIAGYLKALLMGTEGYYRVIVLVVTPDNFNNNREIVSAEEAQDWQYNGTNKLPGQIKRMRVPQEAELTALVYEFRRANESSRPVFQSSIISGARHLASVNLQGEFKCQP